VETLSPSAPVSRSSLPARALPTNQSVVRRAVRQRIRCVESTVAVSVAAVSPAGVYIRLLVPSAAPTPRFHFLLMGASRCIAASAKAFMDPPVGNSCRYSESLKRGAGDFSPDEVLGVSHKSHSLSLRCKFIPLAFFKIVAYAFH
jgi:hypothetical protein